MRRARWFVAGMIASPVAFIGVLAWLGSIDELRRDEMRDMGSVLAA